MIVGLAHAATWDVARSRQVTHTSAPEPPARAEYAALVRDLALAAPSGGVPRGADDRARTLGLALTVDGPEVRLAEPAESLRGAGVVVLRLGALPAELVVQAPHPVSDLRTGAIAAAVFDAGEVRAVVFSTTHRDSGIDPAHAPESWLQAATIGLADALADPLFVQVHGFAAERTEADAVVSQGASRMPDAGVEDAARRLGIALGAPDVRTGVQVPALAARTNVQGRVLAGRARFLHVELSLDLRTRIEGDSAAVASLRDALVDLAEHP